MLIIPNMNLPKNCEECPCDFDGDCMAVQNSEHIGKDLGDFSKYSKQRADFCPLIEKKPGIRILREKRI